MESLLYDVRVSNYMLVEGGVYAKYPSFSFSRWHSLYVIEREMEGRQRCGIW